jgi:hypothetical protein
VIDDGIYPRGSAPPYEDIDAANYSTIKLLGRSPKAYLHAKDNLGKREPSDTLTRGLAAHTAVLEPDRFLLDYVLWEGERRAGKFWDDFAARAKAENKTILRKQDYDFALRVREAVRSDPVAAPYLTSGLHEATIVWTDGQTGIRCKGRPDFITADGLVVDLKTTRSVEAWAFQRQAAKLHYHAQAAFYCDGQEVLTGHPPRSIVIAVESEEPHDVVVYTLDDTVLAAGRDTYREWLAILKQCRDAGRWPGYANGAVMPFQLPSWSVDADEDETDLDDIFGPVGVLP